MVAGLALCEAMGWPFLAGPAQRGLGDALGREVRFSAGADTPSTFRLRLLGGVRLELAYLQIGAPSWSAAPHMVRARDAALSLRYRDLIHWWQHPDTPLRVESLRAAELDGHLERLADGRASWQFKSPDEVPAQAAEPARVPVFGRLEIAAGSLRYTDAPLALRLEVQLALLDGEPAEVARRSVLAQTTASAASPASAAPTPPPEGGSALKVEAHGSYQKQALRISLTSSGLLPWMAENAPPLPIMVEAAVGQARLAFNGTATDVLKLGQLSGRFVVSGPSLAAVGDPLGMTLPTTAAFRTEGTLAKEGGVWRAAIADATVGSSRLSGAFTYDGGRSTPLLSGQLSGSRLLLADLGPAVGVPVERRAGTARQAPADDAAEDGSAPRKVLPDRPFDLPSLRAMDANVLIDVDDVDLGSELLGTLRPLRGHLQLTGGVLSFRNIEAQTGQGRLVGSVQLDGRQADALWDADLRWEGVRLEQWIRQPRSDGQPPYVTGRFGGRLVFQGRGRSTADILGSMTGTVRTRLNDGTVSHLAVEAAGLDPAQALGLLIRGDEPLKVQCAVADLTAQAGVLTPRVFVIDTEDSAVWVDGSISLATEALDLKVVVTPKDFSPLSLRTPLRVKGSLGAPEISLEKGPLVGKVGAAILLSLANPLAALIPFIEAGSPDAASDSGTAGCHDLAQRSRSRLKASPPPMRR